MAQPQAKFKFKGYRVIKSELHITPGIEIDKKLNVSFSGLKAFEADSEYILDLGTEISNEDKSLNISLEMRGVFEFDRDLSDKEKNDFFTGSAPAIMFPYLRAHVSVLTSISGIESILLPTLNFSAGLRNAKKTNS